MKNTQLTIEEKIEKIQNSENFEDLKTGWFPQSASTSYYFVSYCHKDYKPVFVDILGMQQYDSEISVWYDRELNIGHDWEKEAKMHIYDFDCLGVIFYISENSVESPAIFKEMQMSIDAGKPFIPIVLPVEQIRSKAGEYLSGAELFDILYPRLSEEDERYKLYHEMFGKNILYFKNTDSPQEKAERLKKSFTRLPLLEFEPISIMWDYGCDVVAVSNINVIEVDESEYGFFDENNQPLDVLSIGKCAFSNCRQLETITLPKTVKYIDEFAFYNCRKLKTVKLSEDSSLESISNSAFFNCQNLVNITLPNGVKNIGNNVFWDCKSLTSITIPAGVTSIGEFAFQGCRSLTSITIPTGVTNIGKAAFCNCISLASITIPIGVTNIDTFAFANCSSLVSIIIPTGVTNIGTFAFQSCISLVSITIPADVTNIDLFAFQGCFSLTSITFEGTTAEWCKLCKIDLSAEDIKKVHKYERIYTLGIDHEVTVTCADK